MERESAKYVVNVVIANVLIVNYTVAVSIVIRKELHGLEQVFGSVIIVIMLIQMARWHCN